MGARALGGDLCCVMDARAGQVYNALFTVEDGRYAVCAMTVRSS